MRPATASRRLAICGWHEGSPAWLRALATAGGFTPVAVFDPRAAALVRARRATALPCSQNLDILLSAAPRAGADPDALLIDGPLLGVVLAQLSRRERWPQLLIPGEWLDGDAMVSLSEALQQMPGRIVTLLRPRLAGAGVRALLDAADRRQSDHHQSDQQQADWLQLEIDGGPSDRGLIGDAAALACRVLPPPDSVVVSTSGAVDQPHGLALHLRSADALGMVTLRPGARDAITATVRGPQGSLTLVSEGGDAVLHVAGDGMIPALDRFEDGDRLAAEALAASSGRNDREAVLREAPVLAALERSLATTLVERVLALTPPLRLLEGGLDGGLDGRQAALRRPSRGRLHLVAN